MEPIPNWLNKLWDAWNLRSCILISFSMQVILVLIAFLRKRTRSKPVLGLIWLAYLLADWIAPVAIGLISQSNFGLISKSNCGPKGHEECNCGPKGNEELMAFWASFLLLHLGGPDTITSFALEDNEFWLRHLIGLILQLLATAYIILKTLPKNKLLVPTIMVFFVGTVKYVERTRALYLASLDKFGGSVLPEPNPGPDYEELMETYSSMRSVLVSTQVEVMPTPEVGTNIPKDSISTGKSGETLDENHEMQLLQEAHHQFERFKGLIAGLLLSSKVRDMSRDFFLTITPNEAFRLIECELSFMYDVLHTKVVVIRCRIWYFLRFVSFIAILVALLFFLFKNQHELDHNVHKFDIILTYVLLGGALGLEALSVLMLILSDWTLIALKNSWRSKLIEPIILKRRKWSGSISQYDMISYCLNGPPTWVYKLADYVGLGGILDKMKILHFSHSEKFRDDMKSFIFNELRLKSLTANNFRAAMDASSKRGDWALLQTSSYVKLKWSIEEYQYAESLLIWHIATELCYQKTHHSDGSSINYHRETCKLLSDYMFYLLKMKHIMMAPVLGNWQIVFQDTCAEAKRFFHKHSIRDNNVGACERILKVDAKYRPVAVKGSKSKSVFFDGCILAQKLSVLEIDKWKLMSRVWVELMSHAAINCKPNVHAQQPSRGGELLTFIWLLMNHLGLGTQFYQQERQAGAKMVPLK